MVATENERHYARSDAALVLLPSRTARAAPSSWLAVGITLRYRPRPILIAINRQLTMSPSESPDRLDPQATAPANPYESPRALPDDQHGGYVTRSGEQLNPWVSIWTRPRATIRQIVETNPKYMVLLLGVLSGVGQVLDNASMRSAGDDATLGAILGAAVVFGPIGGLITLFVGGWLVQLTGTWLGGVATAVQVRAALAWGQVPGVVALVLWIPQLLLFGSEMFTTDTPRIDADSGLLAALLGISLVELVLGIWQLVLVFKCVGEVHQFSAWKALGAMMLAGLLLVVVIFLPLLIIVLITTAAGPG